VATWKLYCDQLSAPQLYLFTHTACTQKQNDICDYIRYFLF